MEISYVELTTTPLLDQKIQLPLLQVLMMTMYGTMLPVLKMQPQVLRCIQMDSQQELQIPPLQQQVHQQTQIRFMQELMGTDLQIHSPVLSTHLGIHHAFLHLLQKKQRQGFQCQLVNSSLFAVNVLFYHVLLVMLFC